MSFNDLDVQVLENAYGEYFFFFVLMPSILLLRKWKLSGLNIFDPLRNWMYFGWTA